MQAYVAGVAPSEGQEWAGHENSIIVFFAGCNFRCPYCYNSSILGFSDEFLVDTRDVKLKISEILNSNRKSGQSRIDSVIFTGGEPLLQRQALLSVARFCRLNGLKIRIETNGSKPNALRSLLAEGLVDSVVLDLKSPPEESVFEALTRSATFFKQPAEIIKEITSSIELLRSEEDDIDIEFRTVIQPGLGVIKDLLKIADWIGNTNCVWRILPAEGEKLPLTIESFRGLIPRIEEHYPQMKIKIG